MQQIIMNLIVNAAEAMGQDQGVVEVSTFARHVSEEELRETQTREPVPAGQYVELVVRDNGSGMDSHALGRIFEPFYSTKFAGRGLGLSAVLGIVRSHRGALTVDSKPGAGATFRVYLPASQRAAAPVPTPASAVAAKGRGVVLVVDDEEVVRRTARAALDRAGYEVLLAEDGERALAVLDSAAGRIDVVLLDMTMPVMNGEETLQHLMARWPRTAVVASSGYDEQESRRRLGHEVTGFIHKPYTAAQLTTEVAAALNRSRAAHR
jgi:CheY-like chemotaxis protein